MTPIRHLVVVAALLLSLALVAGSPSVRPVHAQESPTPTLEILGVLYDASGTLAVSLRLDGARGTELQNITMFVNDAPVRLDVTQYVATDDLALMLVVDTSGSMSGVPMQAARAAAVELITRLPAGDRVGLMSFDSTVSLLAPPTDDHEAVVALLDELMASGDTALYEAVVAGTDVLTDAPEQRHVMVLLSDGRQFGSEEASREESLAHATDSGVQVFAVGLGTEIDVEYLEMLAAATGGQAFYVSDENDVDALTGLFAQLGGTLASSETYTIPVQPLAAGTHRLVVRGVASGTPVSVDTTFEVSNDGLLRATLLPSAAGTPIEIDLSLAAAHADLMVRATVGGLTWQVHSGSSSGLAIDPWLLPPGQHTVSMDVMSGGTVVATEVVEIDVSALPAQLLLTQLDNEGGILAAGRVQGVDQPILIARQNGEQLARSTTGDLVIEPSDGAISVELLDASGAVTASEEIPPTLAPEVATEAGPGDSSAIFLIALALLGIAVIFVLLRRARRRRAQQRPAVEEPMLPYARTRHPVPSPASDQPAERREPSMGVLVVTDPAGAQTEIPLTRRPLTIGRSPECDVILSDPEVRPQHARMTLMSPTEVRVHALGGQRWQTGGADGDQWIVMESGEQIALGGYQLLVVLGPPDPGPQMLERRERGPSR